MRLNLLRRQARGMQWFHRCVFIAMALLANCLLLPNVALVALGEEEKPEKNLLLGEWEMTSIEIGGETKTPDAQQSQPFVIEAKTMSQGPLKITYSTDETTDPKIMDVEIEGAEGKTFEAIYKVDKDSLVICVNVDDGGQRVRPTTFESPDGSKMVLVNFRRLK